VKKKKVEKKSIKCEGLKPGGKRGFSCYRELKTAKVFIATHRARSKSYDSLGDIPVSVQNFIDSTG